MPTRRFKRIALAQLLLSGCAVMRLTPPSRLQHQAQPLQRQAPFQVVRLDRQ